MSYYATETDCHCGAPMAGADHCRWCGCELFERYCNERAEPAPMLPRTFAHLSDALEYAHRLVDVLGAPAVVETEHLVRGAVVPPNDARRYVAVGIGNPPREPIGTGATVRPAQPATAFDRFEQLLTELEQQPTNNGGNQHE